MACEGNFAVQLLEAPAFADSDVIIVVVDEGGGTLATKKIRKDNFAPEGPPGPAGPQGPDGPQGPAGPKGPNAEWLSVVDRVQVLHQFSGSSNVILGDGFVGSVSANNPFMGDDNTPQGRDYRTSTTNGNSAWSESGFASYQFRTIRTQLVHIGRLTQTTNVRQWIGFTSAAASTFMGGGSMPPQNFAAFRYSAGTDATWKAIVSDGVGNTIVDTGIAPSATVAQTFRVEWDQGGSAVRFYIDNVLVATISTNLPASGLGMRQVSGITNLLFDATTRGMVLNVTKIRETLINP